MLVVYGARPRSNRFAYGKTFDVDGEPIVRVLPPTGSKLPCSIDFRSEEEALQYCQSCGASIVNVLERGVAAPRLVSIQP